MSLMFIWSFSLLFPTILATTATITDVPAYSSQRPCAQDCFYFGGSSDGGADYLAKNMGCDVDPIKNECICRPDLQPLAQSHIRSCVNEGCDSKTVDLNSALSIYNNYCSSNGFTAGDPTPTTSIDSDEPTDTPTDPSPSPSSDPSSSEQPSPTQPEPEPTGKDDQPTPPATESPKESDPPDEGDRLKTGELVGIIVGVLGFVATAVGSWFSYKAIKTRRQAPVYTY